MTERLLSERQNGNGSLHGLDDFFNLIFGVGWTLAWVRGIVTWTGFGLLWVALAVVLHPPGKYASLKASLLAWWNAFFAPNTLLCMFSLLGAWVFARKWAATYIADIFEFSTDKVTTRYLMRAAFGARNSEVLEIRGDNVRSEYPDSPLVKIGGPGLVRIHLESAALFEKIDGTPRVLGPSNAKQRIDGFERLRAVVDLRDQTESFDVEARTRDGILLRAKNVRVLFSVTRGPHWNPEEWTDETRLPRRWEFDEEAIKTLVYGQKKRPWHRALVDGKAKPRLRAFISRYTFQELVSNVLPAGSGGVGFVLRDDLYREFQGEFRTFLERSGIRLNWIGVGRWEPAAETVEQQHLEFWQAKLARQKQLRAGALKKLRNNTRLDTLLQLTRRLLLAASVPDSLTGGDDRVRIRSMLYELRHRLRQAIAWQRRQGRQAVSEEIQQVYRYLGKVAATRFRGE